MSETRVPLEELTEEQLREETARLRAELVYQRTLVEKLTHENAVLKRLKFAAQSERFSIEQRELLEETFDLDAQALADELEQLPLEPGEKREPRTAKHQPLPANLPRREVRPEPDSTVCSCGCQMKRIGEDVAEKLDYVPGVFTVERHIRGNWACAKCERLVQAPVAPHVIDKGIPTAGLLAQVLVAKYADHLPLYRQETIFGRAAWRSHVRRWARGSAASVCNCSLCLTRCARSCCSTLLHADETPVAMLDPGAGKTHRAYLWSYCTTGFEREQLVVFDSPRAAPASTPRSSCRLPMARRGVAPWCATTTPATRRCSPRG